MISEVQRLEMTAFIDADYAACIDTKRSMSGAAVVLIAGGDDQLVLADSDVDCRGFVGIGVRRHGRGSLRTRFSYARCKTSSRPIWRSTWCR